MSRPRRLPNVNSTLSGNPAPRLHVAQKQTTKAAIADKIVKGSLNGLRFGLACCII